MIVASVESVIAVSAAAVIVACWVFALCVLADRKSASGSSTPHPARGAGDPDGDGAARRVPPPHRPRQSPVPTLDLYEARQAKEQG